MGRLWNVLQLIMLTLLGQGRISLCSSRGQVVVVQSRDHGTLVLLMLPDVRGSLGSLFLLQYLYLVLDLTRLLLNLCNLRRLLFAADVHVLLL